MKLSKKVLMFSFIGALGGASQSTFAQDVSIAKAAELSLHRVERLVTLGRIDATYLANYKAMEIELAPTNPDGIKFIAKNYQVPSQSGARHAVKLNMNAQGRTLSHEVITGENSYNPYQWPDKDPVTLSESGLHYILDNSANADIAPYFEYLSSFEIYPGSNNNVVVAVIDFRSSTAARILRVLIGLDGSFVSATFVEPN